MYLKLAFVWSENLTCTRYLSAWYLYKTIHRSYNWHTCSNVGVAPARSAFLSVSDKNHLWSAIKKAKRLGNFVFMTWQAVPLTTKT